MKSKTHTKNPPARTWIESNFQKRECNTYIPSAIDEQRCSCGRTSSYHAPPNQEPEIVLDTWLPPKHTRASPTDAFGTLDFQGGAHTTKAQYVRLAYDTRPEMLLQLFTREWNLEPPKLLITVQGGKANFDLQPKLKKVLRKGLLKAAKTTGAWIFTGGTNTGVTRQVGDALLTERSQRSGKIISLGIAPWGIVENNHELLGINRDVQYHSISSPRSKLAVLNNRHSYFLLVDNGTQGRYGAEIVLRRKLEKFISMQKLHPYTYSTTPMVCLVIEGGTNTIRAVLEYVTDNPPVPVVVCDGSGRAADLIAFMHKYASESDTQPIIESMKDYILTLIQRAFEVDTDKAECLYGELLQCTRKKHLITVFRISERSDSRCQELDQTILTALFKSQHLTPSEQLSLALTWNRVDVARSEIFVYGQEWPKGALEEAMMQALEHDRCDFVKLLLENGVNMRKFLTIPRLEELYNSKQGPSNTLGYILRDVRPHIPRGYVYTLHDIGLVINKLMGGAYRAFYTRRKFRPIYAKVMNKKQHIHRNSSSFVRTYGNAMSLLAGSLPNTEVLCLFDYPFNELLIWAVLMKRQKMAMLMWIHGEEALAKSLVACKLFKAMAHEAAEDDMETEVYEELRSYGKEFEQIALDLLDYCYRQDDDLAQQLLTCELPNWSGQTCLSLAVAANHRALLAHPCSQIILADLWMGGLRTRKNTNLKVVMGLLFWPYVFRLEFKTFEELQLMPQTLEEHFDNDEDYNNSESEKGMDEENIITSTPTRPRSVHTSNTVLNQVYVNINVLQQTSELLKNLKALDNFIPRDTIVQENGKVLSDLEETKYHFPFEEKSSLIDKRTRPLKFKKKVYEFFTAPITKFWANSISYLLFLIIFSYTVLVRMEINPSWQEYLAISYIMALGCEKIREIISSEPVAVSHKLAVWAWNMWNPCDAIAIIFFLIGLVLRLRPSTMAIGRVMYCVDSIYWYLRILNILGVNKYLGPLVTMMGKMVKNMIYFVVLLLVVLMSFGVCRQAILYPNKEASWTIARDVFFEPYFMLYGEVFADGIDPPCGNEGEPDCLIGRWITPAVMAIYLLIANILLINLLIAVFNNIFNEVNAVSHQVWMFQRFTVVMEYEQKPILPPPFILICHIYLLFKYCRRKLEGVRETYDNGLKLFLEADDMERLYDFEEDCVEGYFSERENKIQQSTEDRIKVTTERVENLLQKVEDINTKENTQTNSMQNVEFRLRKVEDVSQEILNHLGVIHRFMATRAERDDNFALAPAPPADRYRRSSDRSEAPSDESHLSLQPPPAPHRKKPTRSLTEVRHDAYIFDDGAHFEVRTVAEESDENMEDLSNNGGSAKHLNVLDERQHSCESKTSLECEQCEADEEDDQMFSNDFVPLTLEKLRCGKRRDSFGGRRSSEGGGIYGEESLHGSRPSLSRRQLSQTQSEPDNTDALLSGGVLIPHLSLAMHGGALDRNVKFAEPTINVIPPAIKSGGGGGGGNGSSSGGGSGGARAMLMAMHTEYTSITDELESVCGLLSPPRTPRLLSPPRPGQAAAVHNPHRRRCASEMSNPEYALFMEKQHLRNAEECDYMLMEDLITRKYDEEEDDEAPEQNTSLLTVVQESREFRNSFPSRALRRSSAIEDDIAIQCPLGGDQLTATAGGGRQESEESTEDTVPLVGPPPQRPSIVIDSSQLPLPHQEVVSKADSKLSLHMQSETMC